MPLLPYTMTHCTAALFCMGSHPRMRGRMAKLFTEARHPVGTRAAWPRCGAPPPPPQAALTRRTQPPTSRRHPRCVAAWVRGPRAGGQGIAPRPCARPGMRAAQRRHPAKGGVVARGRAAAMVDHHSHQPVRRASVAGPARRLRLRGGLVGAARPHGCGRAGSRHERRRAGRAEGRQVQHEREGDASGRLGRPARRRDARAPELQAEHLRARSEPLGTRRRMWRAVSDTPAQRNTRSCNSVAL